jgi:hypothetical protein
MNSSVLGGNNSILPMEAANTSHLGLTPSPATSSSPYIDLAHVGAAPQPSEGLVVPSEEYSTIQLIQVGTFAKLRERAMTANHGSIFGNYHFQAKLIRDMF